MNANHTLLGRLLRTGSLADLSPSLKRHSLALFQAEIGSRYNWIRVEVLIIVQDSFWVGLLDIERSQTDTHALHMLTRITTPTWVGKTVLLVGFHASPTLLFVYQHHEYLQSLPV